MLTLNDFNGLTVSMAQMRKTCGGRLEYSEDFTSSTGVFTHNIFVNDDGTWEDVYDQVGGDCLHNLSGSDLVNMGDNDIIP